MSGAEHHILRSLLALYMEVKDHHPSFCYRGQFLERFTNTILEISEGALATKQHKPTVHRKLSFLLVECFQNIIRHSEQAQELRNEGMFGFKHFHDTFVINSINLILNDDREHLSGLMEKVNDVQGDDLKDLYKRQLLSNEFSAKGGAGLGLIELARKSGHPLLYEFEPGPENQSYFLQQVTFQHGNTEKAVHCHIEESRRQYQLMQERDIVMFYKGDFSQKSILPMLDIVEHNVGGGQSAGSIGRKAGHVLIELLQNVSKHSSLHGPEEKQGIFVIGRKGNKIYIECGNLVSTAERVFLEEKLEFLRGMTGEELRDMHKAAMKASLKFESKNKSGLGLIEIAKASSEPLEYIFQPQGPDLNFFGIHITL